MNQFVNHQDGESLADYSFALAQYQNQLRAMLEQEEPNHVAVQELGVRVLFLSNQFTAEIAKKIGVKSRTREISIMLAGQSRMLRLFSQLQRKLVSTRSVALHEVR